MTYFERRARREQEQRSFDRQYRVVFMLAIIGVVIMVVLAVTGVIPWSALFEG